MLHFINKQMQMIWHASQQHEKDPFAYFDWQEKRCFFHLSGLHRCVHTQLLIHCSSRVSHRVAEISNRSQSSRRVESRKVYCTSSLTYLRITPDPHAHFSFSWNDCTRFRRHGCEDFMFCFVAVIGFYSWFKGPIMLNSQCFLKAICL